MARTTGKALLDHSSALEDPRRAAEMLGPLPEIILLPPPAALRHVGRGGRLRRDPAPGHRNSAFLRRFRPYEHGIPSHDTLGEVIRVLDPELFKDCLTWWVEGPRKAEPDPVAIDGKTSRRTHAKRRGREPLLTPSRPGPAAGGSCSGRRRWPAGRTGSPPSRSSWRGSNWPARRSPSTIDAIRTRSATGETILARGGAYLPALKANRPATLADVAAFFADPPPGMVETRETADGGHGRIARCAAMRCATRGGLAVLGPPPPRRIRLAGLAMSGMVESRTANATARPSGSGATISPRPNPMRRPSPVPCAPTGTSRTARTGCSTSSSATTSPGCGSRPRSAEHGAKSSTWPSTCCAAPRCAAPAIGLKNRRKLAGWNLDYLLDTLIHQTA